LVFLLFSTRAFSKKFPVLPLPHPKSQLLSENSSFKVPAVPKLLHSTMTTIRKQNQYKGLKGNLRQAKSQLMRILSLVRKNEALLE